MGGHPVQTSSNAVSNDKCLVVTNPFVILFFITHLCKIAVQLRVGGVYYPGVLEDHTGPSGPSLSHVFIMCV